jgi:preprotein translocase subunit SecE
VARNRQKAKQRQAERRARRLADQGEGDGQRRAEAQPAEPQPDAEPEVDPRRPETAAGAPPEELGRSDQVLEPVTAPADEAELEEEEEDVDPELAYDAEEAGALESAGEEYAPRGRRGAEDYELGGEETRRERGRFVQFLIHVWAELQRVQWPDRQALTTLTGVVLGFVLIAGGYLGLLDAIFSRLIQAIL